MIFVTYQKGTNEYTFIHCPNTFQLPTRHPLDTIEVLSRHPADTLKKIPRHPHTPNTLKILEYVREKVGLRVVGGWVVWRVSPQLVEC